MLIFDPSAASRQRLYDNSPIGTIPPFIQIHTVDQFTNAFKSLTKREAEIQRPLGLKLTPAFGEYWVEGTNAWHKVIAFKAQYCHLKDRRVQTDRWMVCGCISSYLCYHTAKAYEIHTKLAVQNERQANDLAVEYARRALGYPAMSK